MRTVRFSAALLAAGALVPIPCLAVEAQITLATASGTIHGTLQLPDGVSGRMPVALIVAGSGPTNRDGSSTLGVTVTPYQQLAAALAAHGIASVRYDKRGIAASAVSAPLGNPATFGAYVDDVASWSRQLRYDGRFSRVILVGHSEGSLLALLAAAKAPVDAVVSLEGAGRPAVEVLAEQLTAAGEPAATVARARQISQALRDGKDPGDIPADLMPLFPPSLRTYEQQWFSADPAAAARAATAPLLVVQGGADIQIGTGDAHLLAAAHPGAQLRIFPKMTHVLMDAAGTDRAASLATYTDTSLRIDPLMADTVAAFILQQPLPGTL
jgi:uncharacterized protein